MKKTSKIVLGSALSIAMCASLIAGSTFALFTSESKTNIAVTSGKVDVQADASLKNVYSAVWDSASNSYSSVDVPEDSGMYTFTTGGTAKYADGLLTLSNIAPGDGAVMSISVKNCSTIATKYRVVLTCEGALAEGLSVSLEGDAGLLPALHDGGDVKFTDWTALTAADEGGTLLGELTLKVELPVEAQDTYQEKEAELTVTVEAVQGNANSNGLYISGNKYYVTDGEGLAAMAAVVNSGEDVDIILTEDVDLTEAQGDFWVPIGNDLHHFGGTFDGRNHKITGLTTNSLFRNIDAGATVENFTLDVHLLEGNSLAEAIGLARIVYGSEDKVTTFRNITLTGEVSGSRAYAGWFYNVTSYNSAKAGMVEKETEVLIENCTNEVNVTSKNTNRAVGFIGTNYSASTTFRNCVNKGNLSLSGTGANGAHAGAFVGYSMATGGIQSYRITFDHCINEGSVSSESTNDGRINVGGFISTTQGGSATFIDCTNTGAVTAINNLDSGGNCIVGGFLGCDNRSGIVMTNCKNTGAITGEVLKEGNTACTPHVGGLIGGASGSGTATITDCTSVGTVTAKPQGEIKYVGLICGGPSKVQITLMGTLWLLQEDITNNTPLVYAEASIVAGSVYHTEPYIA